MAGYPGCVPIIPRYVRLFSVRRRLVRRSLTAFALAGILTGHVSACTIDGKPSARANNTRAVI
jgi:hypothetical protein